jgi:hypothetical protein
METRRLIRSQIPCSLRHGRHLNIVCILYHVRWFFQHKSHSMTMVAHASDERYFLSLCDLFILKESLSSQKDLHRSQMAVECLGLNGSSPMLKHVVSLAFQTWESFKIKNNPEPSLSFLPLAGAGNVECLEDSMSKFSLSLFVWSLPTSHVPVLTCSGASWEACWCYLLPGYARCDLTRLMRSVNDVKQ